MALHLNSSIWSPYIAGSACLLGSGFNSSEHFKGELATGWSGFRGRNGCGVAECSLPAGFDVETNLAWKASIDRGYSSPIVVGGRVIVTCHSGADAYVLCLDRATGGEMWRVKSPNALPARRGTPNSPVSATPACDGERIYILFENFGLLCVDLDGREAWRKEMGPFNVPHGMSSSPVLATAAGGAVIVQCDQDTNSYLVALDPKSGEEKWKVERPEVPHGYATPAIATPANGPEQVIVSSAFETAAFATVDGRKLWWVNGMAWQTKTVPVCDADHSHVFIHAAMGAISEFGAPKLSGTWAESLAKRDADGDGKLALAEFEYPAMRELWFLYDLDNDSVMGESEWRMALERQRAEGGVFAIRLGGEGDVTASHVEWSYINKRGMPDIPSPVLYEGVLYLVKDGGIVTSIDAASGEVLKQARAGESDSYFASPVAADGKLILAGQSGRLTVVSAKAEWEVISTAELEAEIWATPAIDGGQVFVRTQEGLFCFGPTTQP
jgi:outer membrane protein assembly factor BamB